MLKAVIQTGSKQYLVTEGDEIYIELIKETKDKSINLETIALIEEKDIISGKDAKLSATPATILEELVKDDKVEGVKFKPKKRYLKRYGHRQGYTLVKIGKVAK